MEKFRELFKELDEVLSKKAKDAIALSDYLADNPEVSGKEEVSSRMHVELLKGNGFDVIYPFLDIPYSFLARVSNGEGAKIALLVEYDALPEIGHACGHNVHGAMSTLAGIALSDLMRSGRIEGELLVIGTPAEETNGAKVIMAEKGVFDDLDLAMMIHAGGGRTFVRYRSLALDALEFEFKGKSSHAASAPWEGRNALNGLQLFFHAIDMLRQHVRPEVRMHGIIVKGGDAPNIVPERAVARFYFRAPWRGYLRRLVEQVLNCAKGCALATSTEVEWRNYEYSFDNMLPNEVAEELFERVLKDIGVELSEPPGMMGSSDIGNVSHRCPALQPVLDITGKEVPLHTREFAELTKSSRAHEALVLGAKALSRSAVVLFKDGELRRAIREAFLKAKEEEEKA